MVSVPRQADVLLVAAHAPDLAGMRNFLGEKLDGQMRGLTIKTKVLGFGMAVAAASCARGVQALNPRAVIMIGTCAVFPGLSQYRPYDVLLPTKVQLADASVLARKAAFPDPMQTSVECHGLLRSALAASAPRAAQTVIASMMAPVTDDTLAASLHAATGCDADNSELFGIAAACQAASVPFAAVLGVSNLVGSTGRHDWAQFQREAVTQAGQCIGTWLHNGAQGLPHG
jgi:nucleoside phosphorylase